MNEAEAGMRTALITYLVQPMMPKDREITDDEALLMVRNADRIARAMIALGAVVITDEKGLPQ